ncbi:conserved hypothetical protein [Talaromyces stipitatus ATCC 10500]|uniref:Uncharacterized protein n=1 Tax=Talaromyces stipitatus (strain ATCC 10500 / CBS 375.48 / QM 6759 / NRRL 1006) TaxID=441959 RepID=B8MIX0_TALSN|nr:uncharacterized protein TSTA_050700 [Talaromyces stipitatus ATCC 10500]EED15632.1 conserved hypothetical protein [Talaromyces stipitatus ATCC 10500]
MSSTGPYLRALRKTELAELAEISDLKDYADLKKAELETALDNHLRANSSIFSGEKRLADYYKRLSQPPRLSSPVKKEPKSESSGISVGEEKRSSRSRRKASTEADESESEKTPSSTAVATRTPAPARSPLSFASLPPSPAVVTDAIDRQTTIVREKVSDAWTKSGISERSDALRATLSSVKSIETIFALAELYGLLRELIPLRYLTTVPAVETISIPEISVKIPDLFVLITGTFWAPFLLWGLTSLALPLTFAYFFNLSFHAQSSTHSHNTRRASSAAQQAPSFDPLVYNIVKALISYFVYANHFTFWSTFSHFSIEKVNVAIPGQWPGVLTGSGIGILISLYDAVLKK